jgi:hypothetical protein
MSEQALAKVEAKLGKYEEDRQRWCGMILKSGLAPKSLNSVEKVFIAVETGHEVGLTTMQALRSVYVVNGMPAWTGQGALSLIRGSGACSIPPVIRHVGEGDDYRAVIRFQRNDMPEPVEVQFSVADAKRAKLWGKSGPWTDYPDDMLMWRAVGRLGKGYFSDVLNGVSIIEEVRDYPRGSATIEVEAPTEPDPLLVDAGEPTEPEPERDPETCEEIPDYIAPENQGEML